MKDKQWRRGCKQKGSELNAFCGVAATRYLRARDVWRMFYVFPYLAQFLLRLGVKYIIGRVCFAHDEWRNFAATALVFYYYFAEDRVEYNFCNGGGVGGWVPF